MPSTTVVMPQLGETVTEGTVAQWLKRVGDAVEKYEPFVEVATDKVNAEIPAPVSGTIRELIVKEGETVPTGAPIAIIEESAAAARPAPSNGGGSVHEPRAGGGAPGPRDELRRAISPAVRRLAREHGVDAAALRGTGAGGRVTAQDVLGAAGGTPAPQRAASAKPAAGQTIALTQARKLIAQRMVDAKRAAPHAWTLVEVDVTGAVARRLAARDAFERAHGVKLTLLPFFMRAVVEALAQFPLMNSRFTDDGIVVHKEVNLGIAVGLEGNLLVPVIKGADRLSVAQLAVAAGALIERARSGKLGPDELSGGTFTVNNTGANGSIMSAPIINAGQAGIITMEAVVKRPVVVEGEAIAIRSMMNVCLSLDHRVVDGTVASGFLGDVKRRLEATDGNSQALQI
jgi:2-oxoisovalerate dehydrogenase E2 component (dihydrolipoyl transacylase)